MINIRFFISSAENVIQELRDALEKAKTDEASLKTCLVETQSKLSSKTTELNEALDKIATKDKEIEVLSLGLSFSFFFNFSLIHEYIHLELLLISI